MLATTVKFLSHNYFMKPYFFLFFFIFGYEANVNSQTLDAGVFYSRLWFPYKYVDYGNGFSNQTASNFNFSTSVVLNKYSTNRFSWELSLSYVPYSQYYSTSKAWGAYEAVNISGHIGIRRGYSFIKDKKIEARVKGGVSLGIAGLYKMEYSVMRVFPTIDSITRGTVKRNFTPIFPMIGTGLDVSYKFANRFKLSLAANFQKGFIKITEYDIYYNDGSGNNDQRAKQWGTGDFYGVQLGLRYLLRDEKGNKFGKKKK